MKKILSIFALAIVLIGSALAQVELIKFDKTAHDFGTVKEEDEKADYAFKFKNTTNTPIKLTYVKASCGCTTPSWTQDIIDPGKTGEVKASFGTSGRPGNFNKSITVTAKKVDKGGAVIDSVNIHNSVLTISGNVTPKVVAPATDPATAPAGGGGTITSPAVPPHKH